ncbi:MULTISPECIES: anthrone oxygenase family protein [unclassified Streptomyces]|uniref:anthrone oxygenase family protein n=1 Tax=unclassified Streptomyces TaxID=2593676 RepID=UPI0036E863DB
MLNALEVVTIVLVGVMVGVEFAVPFFINPILNALPGDNGLRGRIHGAQVGGAVMPFWYIGSLILVGVWAVAGWGDDGAGLVMTAASLLIVSVVMSILVLVPINNRVKTWAEGSRPADYKEQMKRWDRWHYVRIAVIIAAFACLAAALT